MESSSNKLVLNESLALFVIIKLFAKLSLSKQKYAKNIVNQGNEIKDKRISQQLKIDHIRN